HPACRILARYSSNQSLLSALPLLYISLYQAELVQEITFTHYRRGERLLDEIKEAVCKDYRKLVAFAVIVCKDTTTAEIGRAIIIDYRSVYKSDDENGLKIYLPVNVTLEFEMMRLKFGQIFITVRTIMMNNPQSPTLDDIKLRENSSLDNISVLEYLVNEFSIEEANLVIKEYKGAVEELKMKLIQFLEGQLLKVSSLIKYITIFVDEVAGYSVLNDVKSLSSAVLSHHVTVNAIISDSSGDSLWKDWEQESFTDDFDDPIVLSKDATFATEVPAGATESVSHFYQEEEDTKDEDQVMLLQKKVERIEKELEEEKELYIKEEQFHEQVIKEYEEELLQQKRKLIQSEKKIAALTELHEEVIGLLKLKGEQYEELKSDNELTHKQLEEFQKKLKEEIQRSSSFVRQKEVALKEKDELQIKIDDLQQELELQQVKNPKEVSELQSIIKKIINDSETFQKQRKALILENERLMSLLKDHNVPVQQKEETEILQETETVHSCTYISKGDISQLSVILEPVKDDWYHIGQCLEVKESVLTEIKEMTPVDSRLTHVLETWCHEKDRTITELKESLKRMDRDDILKGLHELPTGHYTMNNDEEYDINVKDSKEFENHIEAENKEIKTTQTTLDKEIQFNYLVPSQDNLEGLSESQIAGKKLFLVQGDKPQLMNWEEYGLRISVPEDSLSASETVEVSVLALYIKKEYSHTEFDQNITFKLQSPKRCIELIFNDEQQTEPTTGWRIKPHLMPCQIKEHEILGFGDISTTIPPSCLVSIYAENSPHTVPNLSYSVPLKGVQEQTKIIINRSLRNISSSDPVNIKRSPPLAPPPPTPSGKFRSDIAHSVMTECTSSIKDCGIDINFLVDKLLEHKIVNSREKRKITARETDDEKMDELLHIILSSIRMNGKVFGIFIDILREEDTLRTIALADTLMDKYKE
uniref:Death domain-containing protein n=1 Tax=Amphimedon queenslandica TaxID=400682 RepID=A0A1X7TTR8_AMPQE